ncbi:hypothetical protein TELCIR_16256, partial [Teladorsagia circumcincta]
MANRVYPLKEDASRMTVSKVKLVKSRLIYIYESPKWSMIIGSITSAILFNWLAMLYFTCYPTPLIIEYTRKYVLKNYEIDPNEKAFFGLSMKFISTAEYILLIETFVDLLILGTIVSFCSWSIDHCLRVNAMSAQTKKMHRQMLIMLILQ